MDERGRAMAAAFDEPMRCEFAARDVPGTMRTMIAEPHFTHLPTLNIYLPGIAPTAKAVQLPHVGVVKFERDEVAHEHLHQDQACLLVQAALLDARLLPVSGIGQVEKLQDVTRPTNALLTRAAPHCAA
jgi:hypothetical protein